MASVLKFNCPRCGQRLSVTLDQIDVSAPCPNCALSVKARDCLPPEPPPLPEERKPAAGKVRRAQPRDSERSSRSSRPPRKFEAPAAEDESPRRLVRWLSAWRALSASILVHIAIVVLAGSAVLIHQIESAPDFTAGTDGFLIESGQSAAPPEDSASQSPQFAPPAPIESAPLSALATTAIPPKWQVTAQNLPVRGISESLKSAMNSLGSKLPQGVGGGGMGKASGTRWAMIFGKKITAARLGVILDVSGSAHPHLAGAIGEIQKGFADATMILYPGCGLTEVKGKSGYTIRKYSSIAKKELGSDAADFTTADVLADALEIPELEKMVKRPSLKETLLVAWYEEKGSDGKPEGAPAKLVGQTQVAFEELLKRRVDAIYWFSDFFDKVSPAVAEQLTNELRMKHVVLHLHNFAGGPINPTVTEIAESTGGTVDSGPPQ